MMTNKSPTIRRRRNMKKKEEKSRRNPFNLYKTRKMKQLEIMIMHLRYLVSEILEANMS